MPNRLHGQEINSNRFCSLASSNLEKLASGRYPYSVKLANLEAALKKRPFRPFEIRLDGEVILLKHPEQAVFAEGKTTLIAVDANDHLHILDTDQISKIRLMPRRAA